MNSIVLGLKINIQICCTSIHYNELPEKEIKKAIPFTLTSKRIKYLGANLTQRWMTYTLKTRGHQWKKLKMIYINKDIPCQWMEDLILLNCSWYPKKSIDSMQSLSKFGQYFSQNKKKKKKEI